MDVQSKAETIINSGMPEAQKTAYLKEIGYIKEEVVQGKMPFNVYAVIKKIEKGKMKALQAYPKASGVRLATIEEWDQIFKDF